MEKLNGLDLFSGIGGITKALHEWVQPVAYCEIDPYAQAVLLSKMSTGELPTAPIWDDVCTLPTNELPKIDIIYGGFPCQDISIAGAGKGLEGSRSGLFFEIMRLVDVLRPQFIFLENVPAITSRGLITVAKEITKRSYDSRWCTLSASEVGAPHKRERWWLLANSNSKQLRNTKKQAGQQGKTITGNNGKKKSLANSNSKRLQGQRQKPCGTSKELQNIGNSCWWATEPSVGRVANGVPCRVDRIKGLGNAVVPICAKTAFKQLLTQ
jgi:DNA (cytosine-5)-methyltransferase 1